MKNENYVKIIFEMGSIIFRKVKDYRWVDKSQLYIIEYMNGTSTTLDLMYMQSVMGKFCRCKDNIEIKYDVKQVSVEQCDL